MHLFQQKLAKHSFLCQKHKYRYNRSIGSVRTGNNDLSKGWLRIWENARNILDLEALKVVGCSVLIFWRLEKIADTGWRTGWYKGTVVKYSEETDMIEVEFDTEKGITYKYVVAEEVEKNKLKLAKGIRRKMIEYEEFYEIGVMVEILWSQDELSDTDWKEGWYAAEVQSVDQDDDEIDVVFSKNPDSMYTISVIPNVISGKLKENLTACILDNYFQFFRNGSVV